MHPTVGKLLAAYRETVQPKMRGLPMYNAELQIEAVGFEVRDGRLTLTLGTPAGGSNTCINWVILERAD